MSDTMVTTNRIAMGSDGTVYHCTPQGMVPLGATGPGVLFGAPLVLNNRDPLPAGFWEVLDGQMLAGPQGATIRQVTVGG